MSNHVKSKFLIRQAIVFQPPNGERKKKGHKQSRTQMAYQIKGYGLLPF